MLRKKRPLIVWTLTLLFLLSSAGIAGAAPADKSQPAGVKAPFTDVSSTDKNALYISYMAKRGLITGFPDGTYHPGQGLTRAQAAVLFCKIRGLNPTDKDSTFNDVAGSHWAAGYIAAASQAGDISGFPDGSFHPQENLTRAQGISLFLSLTGQSLIEAELPQLQDVDRNHWAAAAIATAIAASMMETENNTFNPDQAFKRGDLARALSLLLTKAPDLNQQGLIGKLQVKNGTVELKRAGSEKTQTINTASIVRKGDTVITGKDGEAEINYPDGSGILLKPNSQLIIKASMGRAYIVKDGRPGIAVEDLQVELTNGKLFGALASKYTGKEETEEEVEETASNNKYSKIASRDKNFDLMATKTGAQPWYKTAEKKKVKVKVDMPWGVAAIRGTFWNNTVGSNSCGMSLLQGDGSLNSGGQTQNLFPGQSSGSGSSGGPPSPPGPMSPSESREWSQQRGWVGDRAGAMHNNQGAGDPGSEDGGEGEGEGDDPGDEPPDNLMDNLNKALNQADQNAASGSSGSSGRGSSGGSSGGSGGGIITISGAPTSVLLPQYVPGPAGSVPGSGSRCITIDPADAVITYTPSNIVGVSISGCGTSTRCITLTVLQQATPGTENIIFTASRSGYTSQSITISVTVLPVLTTSPNYKMEGYDTPLSMEICDNNQNLWVMSDTLSVQVINQDDGQLSGSPLAASSPATGLLEFSLPGLGIGQYGLVVYNGSNPVGMGLFKVGSTPATLYPSMTPASVDDPFQMPLTDVDPDWFAISHKVYIGEVNVNNEVEHDIQISEEQYFLTLNPASVSLLQTSGNKVVTITIPDSSYSAVTAYQTINAGIVASTSWELNQDLALGQTSTVTIVLKDQYDNICSSGEHASVTIMGEVTIIDATTTNSEIYTLDGALTDQLVEGVCQIIQWINGPSSSFSITIPQVVDQEDGFYIQLYIELDGTDGYDEDAGDIAIGYPIEYYNPGP